MTTDEKTTSSIVEGMTPVGPISECKPIPATRAEAEQPFDHALTLVELAKARLHDISDQDMIAGVGMLMDKLALKTQVRACFSLLVNRMGALLGALPWLFVGCLDNRLFAPTIFARTPDGTPFLAAGYALYPHQV
jgi:hypothetical protein